MKQQGIGAGEGDLLANNVNTEALGDPGIPIAAGSGIVIGGTGLTTQPGTIDLNVPGTVMQALLYWSGGDPTDPFEGDDTIIVNGGDVTGELIGGPTPFYGSYQFLAFRADITPMVSTGPNSFTIEGMDFDPAGNENNGAGLLVIYDDGTQADIAVRDGLDMAFFDFSPTLDATVPQTFNYTAAGNSRVANLVVFAGSVGASRPNEIKVTIEGVDQSFFNEMSSTDGPLWDSISLPITIPAGADDLTVELISTESRNPLGASMSWVTGALSVPFEEEPPPESCRVTGGCKDTFSRDRDGTDTYTCGGQAGAPIASQPQPWGEWTHTQKNGPSGSFTFHAGTASAPPGTEIDWIGCMDPGWCRQARPAPAKQIDFAGVGTFKNMRDVPASISDHATVRETFHWFEVNIDDLGEPGRAGKVDPPAPMCDPLGHGRNGGPELADCECPDFYRIRIHEGPTASSPVMYEVYGYIDRGNFQIHPHTGADRLSGRWR
jgi:hypothetical protein